MNDAYRSAHSRRSCGSWAAITLAAVTLAAVTLAAVATVASGYVVVKEAGHPGPPAPPPVSLGAVSWPAAGVSASDISGIGVVAGPGADRMLPIASVAKVMTGYVILNDHPLSAGESGPDIVVQPQDAAAYPAQVRNGDSLARGPNRRRQLRPAGTTLPAALKAGDHLMLALEAAFHQMKRTAA